MNNAASQNRICVLGGAFNPPTVAHLQLLVSGMELVNATHGVFLPANGEYVRAKLSDGDFTYSDSDRLQMLNALCADDARLSVDDREIKLSGHAYTYNTLSSLRRDSINASIFFIMGADKLRSLPHWYNSDKLRSEFRIIVAARAGDCVEIPEDISHFLLPKNLDSVSASAFRALLKSGDTNAAQCMVTPNVWRIAVQKRKFDRQ